MLPKIRIEPIYYAAALNVAMIGALYFLHWTTEAICAAEITYQAVIAPLTRSRVIPTAKLGE